MIRGSLIQPTERFIVGMTFFDRLPPAALPPMELLGRVSVDSFVIAIVSFAIDCSLAKIFALRNEYSVDATQEFYAHVSFFLHFHEGISIH